MKDIVILVLLAFLIFIMWNGRDTATYAPAPVARAPGPQADEPIDPKFTQQILNQIKTGDIPIETIFIKNLGDGKYSGRFMFFDPKTITGSQYDVDVRDGSVEKVQRVTPDSDQMNLGFKGPEYSQWSRLVNVA